MWKGAQLPHYRMISPNMNSEGRLRAVCGLVNDIATERTMRKIPLWILWRLWKSRNLLLYQRKSSQLRVNFQKAIKNAEEWSNINHNQVNAELHSPQNQLLQERSIWQKADNWESKV